MRVNFQNNFYTIKYVTYTKKQGNCDKKSYLPAFCGDTFVKRYENLVVENFYNQKDKFEISDYKKLSAKSRKHLRKVASKEQHQAADINIDMALKLKEQLDKLYGNDGYIFVSIGRSPSLIAKVLENSGVETKYLPLSGLGRDAEDITHKENIAKIKRDFDFKKYSKFLKSQNLTPLKMITTPKKYLFYDYTKSGASLSIFKEFLTKKFHLPEFKMDFRSLNNDLLATNYDSEEEIFYYIDEYLWHSSSEKFSSIARLDYYKTAENDFAKVNLTKHDDSNVKFYNFLVIDKLNRYGLLKENPKNSSTL